MNAFDLIVLVVLALFTFRGLMKGMVSQIVSVGSYIVCWIVASRFAFVIAPSIPAEEPWNQIGAMIILFVATMIGIRFIHGVAEKQIKDWHLAKANKALGGTLGFAKGLLICMVLTFFGVMLSETSRTIVFHSKSGLSMSRLIAKTGGFIPKGSCQMLEDQLDRFYATVDGTPLDSTLEADSIADMLQDGLASLKQTAARHGHGDSVAESNAALSSASNEISSTLSGFFDRGNRLLEQIRTLQDVSGQHGEASSLLDGIGRWWSGESKKESDRQTVVPAEKQAIQAEAEALLQEAEVFARRSFAAAPKGNNAENPGSDLSFPNAQHNNQLAATARSVSKPPGSDSSGAVRTAHSATTSATTRATNSAAVRTEPTGPSTGTLAGTSTGASPSQRPQPLQGSFGQEESFIRNGTLGAERLPTIPTSMPTSTQTTTPTSTLPLPTGQSFYQTAADTTDPPFLQDLKRNLGAPVPAPETFSDEIAVQQDAMSIPRKSTRFMLRKIAADRSRSSELLLNSTMTAQPSANDAPARLFSPSIRPDQQPQSIRSLDTLPSESLSVSPNSQSPLQPLRPSFAPAPIPAL